MRALAPAVGALREAAATDRGVRPSAIGDRPIEPAWSASRPRTTERKARPWTPLAFDRIAKRFADRRRTRRRVLAEAGAGLAAGALAATGLGAARAAQDATPATGETGEKVEYLFVQSFRSGTVAPKAGEDGTYTLTLAQGLGQTIAFSDRPDRIVGAAPTAQFLKGLGFPPDNPPNAALIVEASPGSEEIAVVELFNPVYEEATHTATYDVTVLHEWEESLGVGLTQTPNDLAALAPSFGAAHLFIDDCSDGTVTCANELSFKTGYCSDPGSFWCCKPCTPNGATDWEEIDQHYRDLCTQLDIGLCNGGRCTPTYHEDDPAWACGR